MHNFSIILGASLHLLQRWRTQGHSHLIFTEALAFFMPLSSTEGQWFVHTLLTAAQPAPGSVVHLNECRSRERQAYQPGAAVFGS